MKFLLKSLIKGYLVHNKEKDKTLSSPGWSRTVPFGSKGCLRTCAQWPVTPRVTAGAGMPFHKQRWCFRLITGLHLVVIITHRAPAASRERPHSGANQPALLVRFNLLPWPEGAERTKYDNPNNKTQRLGHSAALLLQVGACVAETLLVLWRFSHWDGLCGVFYLSSCETREDGGRSTE